MMKKNKDKKNSVKPTGIRIDDFLDISEEEQKARIMALLDSISRSGNN
jgi:hypothetical protein